MATTKTFEPSKHRAPGSLLARLLHFRDHDAGARLAANELARFFEKNSGPRVGGGIPYNASAWTITTGGTGDAQAQATTPGGGILITYASDDNFDTTLDWACGNVTPTTGRWYAMLARMHTSDATGLGFKIGLTTGGSAAALPFGTNYTDVIGFSKPIASAAMVGTVRGNSGTAADSSTLATIVAATEVEIGFVCYLHATTPVGSWFVDGVETAFTANQLTQLAAILTTPPTMYWTVHGTGVTATNPTLTLTSMLAEEDAA